ncbi:Uncharacterised protein [BD1-7 clade bacterium]|uniref:N-acetyltransferase domain-containing protein n=1 Tax=BD1-7 clade bacterium TaxID=2029982 RepID=A0A5S9P4I9_9GAMM|nr:Uncharacterised protein [BD1-7 clade bacterium]CAA0098221.1 Uncharacterised protein [BD1-7 clade bacterium]
MAFNDVELKVLDCRSAAQTAPFRSLTYAAMQHLFDPMIADQVCAVGLSVGDAPVGLALARRNGDVEWEMASFFIQGFWNTEEQRQRLFGCLVNAVNLPSGKGYYLFTLSEADGDRDWQQLKKLGWHTPVYRGVSCEVGMDDAVICPWIVSATLPEAYRIVEWGDLDVNALSTLKQNLPTLLDQYHPTIDPFHHLDGADTALSLALVKNNTIVGWHVVHRLDDAVVRWSCSCILDRSRHRTWIFSLWKEAIFRQQAMGVERFIFVVQSRQPTMAEFAVRRLKPAGTRISGLYHATYG